jgi:hypothetical protein
MTNLPAAIVKWPFFAGDGLCIATAAAILLLAEQPLARGVTAAAVVCLLIGAFLAIMPYLIGHEVRLRMAEASVHASIEGQIRKATGFAEQLNHSVSRSQATAEGVEKILASAEESMEKLSEQVESITQWAAEKDAPGEIAEARLADLLKSVEAEVQKLSQATADLVVRKPVTPDALPSALAELNRRLDTAFRRLDEESVDGQALSTQPDPIEEPAREPDDDSPSNPGPTAQAVHAETIESSEYRIGRTTENEGGPTGVSPDNSHLAPSEQAEDEPRFTFNEDSTSLIATAYIGIGNKLFLRGDGPGLSWEEGVPMQFLSIGKWGWSSLDIDAPITCRIYKNDDEPPIDGDIILNPSELKEISPRF